MRKIRKIIVGPDLKEGMHYVVGKHAYDGHDVCDIIGNKDGSYDIYILKGDEVKPWFTVKNNNIKVEYDLDY